MRGMDTETKYSARGGALVVSWYPVQDESSGGRRRVGELLRALAPRVGILQPAPAHPDFPGVGFPVDFGRRKLGINWGMFNFRWPPNRRLARRLAAEWKPSVIVSASIWCHAPFDGLGIPRVLDAQNVDAATIAERFGPRHPFTRLVAAAERRALAESELVFCCSDADAERFRRGDVVQVRVGEDAVLGERERHLDADVVRHPAAHAGVADNLDVDFGAVDGDGTILDGVACSALNI